MVRSTRRWTDFHTRRNNRVEIFGRPIVPLVMTQLVGGYRIVPINLFANEILGEK
jgi:hypothetical protein